MKSSKDLRFSCGYFHEYVFTNFLKLRIDSGVSIHCEEISVQDCKLSSMNSSITRILSALTDSPVQVFMTEVESSNIVVDDFNLLVTIYQQSHNLRISVYYERGSIPHVKFLEAIKDEYRNKIFTSHVNWIYDKEMSSIKIPLNSQLLPVDEMYPFLNGCSLTEYYTDFLNSNSNTLILIGPPGTGKTTFIRGLLSYTDSSAIVCYDENLLSSDELFASFFERYEKLLVLEDADNFLRPRSEGNSMMQRFLNIGDGLISTKSKKIIFSTNLPNVNDVDPALVRPGRCYDVLNFDYLSKDQAKSLADKMGVSLEETSDDRYTIAKILSNTAEDSKDFVNKLSKKVGF